MLVGMGTPGEAPAEVEPRWLDSEERATWLSVVSLLIKLPAALDAQLQRDAGFSHFEYNVLAGLSQSISTGLPGSQLAPDKMTDWPAKPLGGESVRLGAPAPNTGVQWPPMRVRSAISAATRANTSGRPICWTCRRER